MVKDKDSKKEIKQSSSIAEEIVIGKNPELGYTSSGDRLQETLPLTAPISDEPKSIPKSVSLSIGDLKDTQPTSNQTKDETRKDLKLPEKEAVVNSKTDSEGLSLGNSIKQLKKNKEHTR